jgi:hypothetical protein
MANTGQFPINASMGAYAGMSGNYIPELWAGPLLEKFYKSTVFGTIANTQYEGTISSMGDTVIINTVPDIAISDYEIGKGLSYQTPEPEIKTLKINKGKSYAIAVNDVEKKQSKPEYIDAWTNDAGEQLKIAIDTQILGSVYSSVAAANQGLTAGADSASVSLGVTGTPIQLTKAAILDKIVECGLVLDEQNVPDNNRWMVLPSWAIARLKISDELGDASVSGDGKAAWRNGQVGMIDRFMIYRSNTIAKVTDTVTCYNAVFGHKSALTFASQLTETNLIPNPDDFGELMRGLQVYGYEVIKPEAMGWLYCKP